MRTASLVLLLFLANTLHAQQDLSPYLRLKVAQEPDGDKQVYVSTFINSVPGDRLSRFVNRHHYLFEYVLINKTADLRSYSHMYPDTPGIQSRFATYIRTDSAMNGYFSVLTGNVPAKQQYSVAEMMHTASRFFMCDRVKPQDTSLGYHICIGLNGQKELNNSRDLTVLEAFCFEAIFQNFTGKHDPAFLLHFDQYVANAKHALPVTNLDAFLEAAKNYCYNAMEHDDALQQALLKYYKKNRKNLGFVIQ